ncbi:hypothetical protein PVK06_033913 [Gossypium arboreum]|uniref:Protein transport protein Sec61 subunit gamma n=2 Tax=Gossypium TaxID=3633 RepID=A0ABR0NCP6_GOSAR|nr:hypothetical protein PVK06_033913 [Gossypium arboreum]
MDAIDSVFDPLREFAKDSVRLVKRCHKPDRKEFTKVAFRTAIGFVVMGFVGFFVKLIFIPINNIIVGSVSNFLSATTKTVDIENNKMKPEKLNKLLTMVCNGYNVDCIECILDVSLLVIYYFTWKKKQISNQKTLLNKPRKKWLVRKRSNFGDGIMDVIECFLVGEDASEQWHQQREKATRVFSVLEKKIEEDEDIYPFL